VTVSVEGSTATVVTCTINIERHPSVSALPLACSHRASFDFNEAETAGDACQGIVSLPARPRLQASPRAQIRGTPPPLTAPRPQFVRHLAGQPLAKAVQLELTLQIRVMPLL